MLNDSKQLLIFSDNDKLIQFNNDVVNRYFYTENELRRMKLLKLKLLNENIM